MYEPSNNFYTQVIQKQARRITWSGTVTADGTSYPFNADKIAANSGRITNEISGSSMEIGTVYSSELEIGLYIDEIGVPRDKIYGAEISLSCTVTVGNKTGTIPMGVFIVVEATQKGQLCSIVAYDRMILFDTEYPITSGMCSPYYWLSDLCNGCGVTLGSTQQEIEALPNGSYQVSMNWTSDTDTYRDVLSQLAGALGSSAHFGRDGNLYLIPLKNKNSVATLNAGDRFGSDLSHTQWTPNTILVTNRDSGGVTTAGSGQLLFNLGQNAFLQETSYSYDEVNQEITSSHSVSSMLNNILTEVHGVTVVPIDADIPLDPCLDLFDIVTLTGGQASNTKVLITSIKHTIGGATTIECAGANTTEESNATSRGSESSREDWLWVSGAINDSEIIAQTQEQTWGDLLDLTWQQVLQFTWGGLLNGGNWFKLEDFERYFEQEFTLGVIGLTTEYSVDVDTDVKLKITIEKWDNDLAKYTSISQWACQEHAIKGKHTTSLVSPFGILDNDHSIYRITAYISGVDVVESSRILTKEEIEALIFGGESS